MSKNKKLYFIIGIAFLLIIGLVIRLFLAYFFFGNFDQESYEIVADYTLRGMNVYAMTDRYNYSPLWSYVLAGLDYIALEIHLPFHFILRSFLTAIDLLDAFLIALIADRNKSGTFWFGFFAYWLNPVSILIIGFHGQFDNLSMLPLLVAVFIASDRQKKPALSWIWILGTLSILIKQISLFSVVLLFYHTAKSKFRTAIMLFGAAIVFLSSFIPFIRTSEGNIFKNVFLYHGNSGIYGFGSFLPINWALILFILGMTAMIILSTGKFHLPLSKTLEFSVISFLALTYGIGEQYFLLPVLWGSIHRSNFFWLFSLIAGIFLLGSGNNINLPGFPNLWNSVWLVSIGWLVSYFFSKTAIISTATNPEI